MPEVVSEAEFALAVAKATEGLLMETMSDGVPVSLALSGGTTPGPVYSALARTARFAWRNVVIVQTDERCVPSSDHRSNYALIRSTLLKKLDGHRPLVIRMEAGANDPIHAAAAYAARLPERLDLAVLGIGVDGHLASIFPRTEGLWESGESTAATVSPDGEPRITLTPKYLMGARHLVIFACGAQKAEAVGKAFDEASDRFVVPVAGFRTALWILDEGAASRLV